MDVVLESFFNGDVISGGDYLKIQDCLKKGVLQGPKGLIAQLRKESIIKAQAHFHEVCNHYTSGPKHSADKIVKDLSLAAYHLNTVESQICRSNYYEYIRHYDTSHLSGDSLLCFRSLKNALDSYEIPMRERAYVLSSQILEQSLSQSNKSRAGDVAEKIIEGLFISRGMKNGIDFGSQFTFKGSDTDFIIPYAEDGKIEDVRATIAVQMSTNDRARLLSSELHRGAKRFVCSFNGCIASTKATKDIGDDLIAKFSEEETHYVVIDEEKSLALKHAKEKLQKSKESKVKGSKDITNIKKRLNWLKQYSINYDEFINECLKLSSR